MVGAEDKGLNLSSPDSLAQAGVLEALETWENALAGCKDDEAKDIRPCRTG
jgi:hypothetical protein